MSLPAEPACGGGASLREQPSGPYRPSWPPRSSRCGDTGARWPGPTPTGQRPPRRSESSPNLEARRVDPRVIRMGRRERAYRAGPARCPRGARDPGTRSSAPDAEASPPPPPQSSGPRTATTIYGATASPTAPRASRSPARARRGERGRLPPAKRASRPAPPRPSAAGGPVGGYLVDHVAAGAIHGGLGVGVGPLGSVAALPESSAEVPSSLLAEAVTPLSPVPLSVVYSCAAIGDVVGGVFGGAVVARADDSVAAVVAAVGGARAVSSSAGASGGFGIIAVVAPVIVAAVVIAGYVAARA